MAAADPAMVMLAIGADPKRAKEFADYKNPIELAYKMGRLEEKMKMVKDKRKPPPPDESVSGGAPSPGGGVAEKKLEAAEIEADKTGDRTKVIALKRSMGLL